MATSDLYLHRFSARTRGMSASEIRALFEMANRPEIISLAGGNPDVSLLDHDAVAETTQRVLATRGNEALSYGTGQGRPELRESLTWVMKEEGVVCRPDDLVVTTGGQQALDLLGRLFIDPGDVIVAEGPTYVGALSAFSQYGPRVVHVPTDEHGWDPRLVRRCLEGLTAQGVSPKMLYTIPNHQNPSGVSQPLSRREGLVELAREFDVMILEDNPYGLLDFKYERRTALRSLAPERVIYMGTLSKVFSPGIRTGWVLAPTAVRDRLIQCKEASDLCQSGLVQLIADEWLRTQPWLDHVQMFTEAYRERCDVMLTEIESSFPSGTEVAAPTGGLFTWVTLPEGLDAGALLPKSLAARVAYVPGRGFYAGGVGGRNQLRLNFSSSKTPSIREGVRRLGRLFRDEQTLHEALGR